MKRKIIIVIAAIGFIMTSCNKYITPYQAAHGKARCGKVIR